jgi:hypothetical protein
MPALLARFPKPFWWRPDPEAVWPNDWPVLPETAESMYPALASDFLIWRNGLEQDFRRLDHLAQVKQQQFWRQQVTLIVGGLLATILGATQATLGGGQHVLAAVQAVLAGLLTGLTALVRGRRAQQAFLTTRLTAERLKSEYFLYLARAGEYARPEREELLRNHVDDITNAAELI